MPEKLHFDTDYMRGAHPVIMNRLMETNMLQTPGYGSDEFTIRAKELIREACDCGDAEVFFLTGGTQTNVTVINGLLRNNEGVIAATTSHINVHEAGAIEASGHKVLTLPTTDGKISADEVKRYLDDFYSDDTNDHMVEPGMVYISYPTELGTLYTYEELSQLSELCRNRNIILYLDGARLGYGLAAQPSVTLGDIARLCDVFYIGGTKVGALFGEAVVVTKKNLIRNVTRLVKRHGALLAKGRLLGLQFECLFSDGLYGKIGENAITTAMMLKRGFLEKGYRPLIDSPSNQQFFVLPNETIEKLKGVATFEMWGPPGERESAVRFVTDWATSREDVEKLLSEI